jgi:hypothetical protein
VLQENKNHSAFQARCIRVKVVWPCPASDRLPRELRWKGISWNERFHREGECQDELYSSSQTE